MVQDEIWLNYVKLAIQRWDSLLWWLRFRPISKSKISLGKILDFYLAKWKIDHF